VKVRRERSVAWRTIGDETVVVHLANKMMYGLNEPGGRVWEALAEPIAIEDLERLIPAAAEDDGRARAALRAFVAELEGEGLVVCEPHPPAPAAAPERGAAFPAVTWREEIRKFAGGCGLLTGQSGLCATAPTNSL